MKLIVKITSKIRFYVTKSVKVCGGNVDRPYMYFVSYMCLSQLFVVSPAFFVLIAPNINSYVISHILTIGHLSIC